MQIVRDAQFAAFRNAAATGFCRQMVKLLRGEFPQHVAALSDAQLEQRSARSLDRARRHGLERDADVVAFVTLTFTLAPAFDEHPAFLEVLSHPRWSGEEKMRRLFTVDSEHFVAVARRA